MITRDLRCAIANAVAAAGFGRPADPGLRPTGTPGQYAASVALTLGQDPRETAQSLAAQLAEEQWIARVEVTGPGYLTITVTPEALAAVAGNVTSAGPACVTSNALADVTVPAALPGDPLTARHVGRGKSGARRAPDRPSRRRGGRDGRRIRASPERVPASLTRRRTDSGTGVSRTRSADPKSEPDAAPQPKETRTGSSGRPVSPAPATAVARAVAFAGRDAVTFTLARAIPGKPLRVDPEIIARHVLGNPAYAVRYAHARAASGVRWAATSSAAVTIGSVGVPLCPPTDPGELALLDALSWLPERVATAARRGRPDEFARYLEDLASVTVDILSSTSHPDCASPDWAAAPGSDRLTLAMAARTGLAAGLGLLGVSAPERLLAETCRGAKAVSRVAHPAGPRHGDVLPADHPPTPPEDLNALHPAIWPRGARRVGGVLTLGGIDVRDLATEFGTPALIMDEADVRSRAREYVDAFGEDAQVYYASKAFCSRAVLRWVTEEGLGVDVCTGGELAVALSAGVDPALITLHGNNKLPAEIEQAVAARVGHIVVDSFEEIARLAYHAEAAGVRPRVLVRVTTGVEAHTHEFMATAHDDQKFGFSLASGAADEAVRRVLALPQITFAGLHSHIGSQIFDTGGFEVAARRVLELAGRIHLEHGVHVAELDLGGGFGIAYVPEDDAPEVKTLASGLRAIVASQCLAFGIPVPRLTIEPGRGIIGPSTVTLYEVGTIKDVDGIRTYVSVDGGMSDNIRTALYDASYTCVLASRSSAAPPMLSRVVGRHCESGDIVVRHCYLPSDLAPGDLLAVAATGAYCRSLASNYNHLPRPGVVAVAGGAAREIVRRETLEDLLRLDVG